MPPQPLASRPELGSARRSASFSTAARAGLVAWVCRPRRLFCRCLCHYTPKAHPCPNPAAEADRVTPKPPACPRPAAETDRSVRAGPCEHAVRPAAGRATEIAKSVREPMAQKLIEWVILRSEESGAGFDRYAAFIRDAVTVRRFLDGKP